MQEYRATSHASVAYDGHRADVMPSSKPQLEIRCRDWPEKSRLRVPLETVSAEGDVLEVPGEGNTRSPIATKYVEPGSNGYFGLNGQWLPWGGMEIAYFF